jgi:hypothetical protein
VGQHQANSTAIGKYTTRLPKEQKLRGPTPGFRFIAEYAIVLFAYSHQLPFASKNMRLA